MTPSLLRAMRFLALALVVAAFAFRAEGAEDIVTLTVRAPATESYLLTFEPGRAYQVVAVLFPGGDGHIGLARSADGVAVRSNNFLVRTRRQFAAAGIAGAIIETPSDMPSLSDLTRMDREHMADIASIVQDVKRRFPSAKVFLVGTSRGTVSAAYAAAALGNAASGVVLTSAVYNASGRQPGLSGFDFAALKVPLLIVHHREDACPVCPYSKAESLAKSFPLISVSGGLPPQSGPCDPLSEHGYFGREDETVRAIAGWMLGAPYSKEIK